MRTKAKYKIRSDKQGKPGRNEEILATLIEGEYPNCPLDIVAKIARFACIAGSKRVGTAELHGESAYFAVFAYIRHNLTEYDKIIRKMGRDEAREAIRVRAESTLHYWKQGK